MLKATKTIVIRAAPALVWIFVLLLATAAVSAQQGTEPKRVLVLYWDNKDLPTNALFDKSFQAGLRLASEPIEYYPEYLESNRFPGESQTLYLRDFLRQKYAGRKIDVVVASADASFEFLLKYRAEIFPNAPIVCIAVKRPTAAEVTTGPGITGLIRSSTHRQTLDLALRLHPDTEQVYAISGTSSRDKRYEMAARNALEGYSRVKINYLTDLPPHELLEQVKSLPRRSIIFWLWQQSEDEQGRIVTSPETLALVARSAQVPIYAMNSGYIESGIVGGYVVNPESYGAKVAEIVLRILKGTRAQDIAIENAPAGPMFDWRQLRRWQISEKSLPAGSIVLFREYSFWEKYRGPIVGTIFLFVLQSLFIGALLIERVRRRRAEEARRLLAAIVEGSHDAIIGTSLDGKVLSWNPGAKLMYGYEAAEMLGTHISILVPPDHLEDFDQSMKRRRKGEHIKDYETVRVTKNGTRIDVSISVSPIIDKVGRVIADATITRDISERKRSAQEMERLTGHLLHLQDDERRRLARELHDVTAQNLFVINMNLSRLQRSRLEPAEVQEIIDESRMLGNQSIQEIRTLSYLLHPPMLDQLGLVDALKWYVGGFVKRSGIEVEVLALHEIGRLPSEVETALFRIVQEGLTNIKRHSGSSSAKIKLDKETDRIVLEIRDYGCGMRSDPTASQAQGPESPGVGIPGMRQRMHQLGGDLAIASSNQGMVLTAIVPMTNGDGHDSNPAG